MISSFLTPRDLAQLRDPDSGDSVSSFTLDGVEAIGLDGTQATEGALDQPLPEEARVKAHAKTLEMHRHFFQGQHNEAFRAGREALALWHALQDHDQSCDVLRVLSLTCIEHEQGVEALALGRHALRLARARVLPQALVQSLSALGVLHARLHDVNVGETLVLHALSRAREMNDRSVLMQTLDALLSVLLEAHELQRLAGDVTSMQATVQRLHRHTNHALAQTHPWPDGYINLQLRVLAGAALVTVGRAADALPTLTECIELARQSGFHGLSLWARLYGAQASMLMDNDAAASSAVQTLAPQLSAEDPPRLRLACASLQALLAERAGDAEAANQHRLATHNLREALLRQRLKLQATLRRNANDVMQTLSNLDREWQERSLPLLNAKARPIPGAGEASEPSRTAAETANAVDTDDTGTEPNPAVFTTVVTTFVANVTPEVGSDTETEVTSKVATGSTPVLLAEAAAPAAAVATTTAAVPATLQASTFTPSRAAGQRL